MGGTILQGVASQPLIGALFGKLAESLRRRLAKKFGNAMELAPPVVSI